MGHSGTRMLDRYVHPNQKHQQEAMERFGQKFGNIAELSTEIQ